MAIHSICDAHFSQTITATRQQNLMTAVSLAVYQKSQSNSSSATLASFVKMQP